MPRFKRGIQYPLQQFLVDLNHAIVMRGLDPRIHHLCKIYTKKMDPRVKPASDGGGWAYTGSNRPGNAIACEINPNPCGLLDRPVKPGDDTHFLWTNSANEIPPQRPTHG
jgi:hypothetical protein